MPMYTFHLCAADGGSPTFEAFELPTDADTFAKAGILLTEHPSCNHVDVWQGERAVVSRHREPPVIRRINQAA